MNISENIIAACNNTFPMFGFESEFINESIESNINSSSEVNLLIGLSNGLQANIVISFSRETALDIVSKMMGGMEVQEIDDISKSALGEMANMLIGATISGIDSDNIIELSPPTIAIGDDMFIMLNNINTRKLEFKLADNLICLSYAIS